MKTDKFYVEVTGYGKNSMGFTTERMSEKKAFLLADTLAKIFADATPDAKTYLNEEADVQCVGDGYEIFVWEASKNEDDLDIDQRHIIIKQAGK